MYTNIRELDINKGDIVIVRTDYNVPLDSDGDVISTFRIRKSLPTIDYLIKKGAKIVVISHLGRPKKWFDSHFTLKPIARILSKMISKNVDFCPNFEDMTIRKHIEKLYPGGVLMLENIRYLEGEEQNDKKLAEKIALVTGAKFFVQDGFGVIHRKHMSTHALPKILKSGIGFLIGQELFYADKYFKNPPKKMMAVIGGAKIADKIDLLKRMIKEAEVVVVGGAMANTFLAGQEYQLGSSILDPNEISDANKVLEMAKKESTKRRFVFYVPEDVVVANSISKPTKNRIVEFKHSYVNEVINYPKRNQVDYSRVNKGEYALDIGPYSAGVIAGLMREMEFVVWNGSLGYVEKNDHHTKVPPFAHGSIALINSIKELGLKGFVGGGDTVGFIENEHLENAFEQVSTGGGALLEYINGNKLPGLEVFKK